MTVRRVVGPVQPTEIAVAVAVAEALFDGGGGVGQRRAETGGGSSRRRRFWIIGGLSAGMAAVLIVVGLVVLTGGDESESPETTHPVAHGVSWPSGTNANPWSGATGPEILGAWEAWLGRPTDIAVVFVARTNWQTITGSDWPMNEFPKSSYPGQLSIAVPPFPHDGRDDGTSEAQCAQGAFDQYWAGFGQVLNRNGRGDAIIRLGWEFNGEWFYWYPRDTRTWVACYQRVVTSIRSTAPGVLIDFNVSAHRNTLWHTRENLWNAYPGDEFVDIVSIDAYDSYPPSLTQKTFDEQCRMNSGACTVAQFARDHGKRFAVPEWGLVRTTNGGGDNPFYIEKMYEFFEANKDILAYEAYYNAPEPDNVQSSLVNPPMNPNGAAKYLELFGPVPAVVGAGTATPTAGAPVVAEGS